MTSYTFALIFALAIAATCGTPTTEGITELSSSTPIQGEGTTELRSSTPVIDGSTTELFTSTPVSAESTTWRTVDTSSTTMESLTRVTGESTIGVSFTPLSSEITPVYGERTPAPYSRKNPKYLEDITCPRKKLIIRCHEKDIKNLVKLSIVEKFDESKKLLAEESLEFISDVSGIYDIFHEETHWIVPAKHTYPVLLRTIINTEICPMPTIKYLRWETINEKIVKLKINNKWHSYENPSPTTPFTVLFPEEVTIDRFSIVMNEVESGKKGGIGKLEMAVCCDTK